MIRSFVITLAAMVAGSAHALVPGDCTRTTHISHGGEVDHVDLGEGRVMWLDWWSQEGTAKDVTVMDCKGGQALKARVAEDNMNARLPFDRTQDAMGVIARHESGARVFATLERIAGDLEEFSRDVRIETLKKETCACAAFYPEARGSKTKFRLEGS